ncbi:myogenesis-regulating glycosidase-like [Styela clava]
MNNNSPRKNNGYARFASKPSYDQQEVGLIADDDDTVDDLVYRDDVNGRDKPDENTETKYSMRVSMERMNGVNVKTTHSTSCKLKFIVTLCGSIIIIGMILILHFYNNRPKTISIGDGPYGLAQLCLHDRSLKILDHMKNIKMEISIAGDYFPSIEYDQAYNCNEDPATMSGMCLRWPEHNTTLSIISVKIPISSSPSDALQCLKVSWSYKHNNIPEDCIYLDSVDNGEIIGQNVWFDTQNYVLWPQIQDSSCVKTCSHYVTGSQVGATEKAHKDMGGTVVEPLWMSSQALLVKASLHDPLLACSYLCHNATRSKLCLKTRDDDSHHLLAHSDVKERTSNLTYVVCAAENTKELYEKATSTLLKPDLSVTQGKLSNVVNDGVYFESGQEPSHLMTEKKKLTESCSFLFKRPLWNIVFNKDNVEKELNHIKEIGGTGILCNMSDIFTAIGDFELRNDSNINTMTVINSMHGMGFKVMLPVSPFVNFNSDNFQKAVYKDFLVKSQTKEAPVLTNVPMFGNRIYPGIVDFTNPETNGWFAKHVDFFKTKFKIDYIHLFFGQASWLPAQYSLHNPLHNPSFYSTLYTNVGRQIGTCTVTDVAFSSQGDRQIVMLKAVDGLESTMKLALASGLAGYPFFIPNLPFRLAEVSMMGPADLEDGFIRWIQLVSFFPVAHMPWDFDALSKAGVNFTRLTSMVKKCMNIRHGPVVGSALEAAMQDADKGGSIPIISPLWMAANVPPVSEGKFEIERIYKIQDQFMIGENIMFAPVLQMGQRSRSVYFPAGQWTELNKPGSKIGSDGRLWLSDYRVDLDDILIFVRKI